jgi:hypothetical protein
LRSGSLPAVIHWAGVALDIEHALERPLDVDERGHVVANELKLRVVLEVRDVRGAAGDEIVHPDDPMPRREQPVTEVGAEKACDAGYEDAHTSRRPMLS